MLATRYANVSDVLVSRSTIDALSGSYSWRVTFHPLFDQNISLQLSSSSLFLNTNVRANVSVTRLQEALSFRTIDYSKITLSFMNYSTRPITLLPFHKASFMNVSSVLNASITNSLSDAVDQELELLPSIGRVKVFESGCPDLSKIHFRASQDCIAMTIRFGAENDLNVNTLSPRHLGSVPLLQIHVLSGFVEHATVKVDRKGRGYLNYSVSVTNNGVDFSSPALSGNKLSFFELENVKITQLYPPLGPEFGGTLVILSLYYDALDRSSTRSPYALHLPGFNRESNSAFCRFGNTVVPAVFVDSTDRIAPQWLQELGVDVINGASSIAKLISTTATPPMPFSIFSLLCVTPPHSPGPVPLSISFTGASSEDESDFSDPSKSPHFLYVAQSLAVRSSPISGTAEGGTVVTIFGLNLAPKASSDRSLGLIHCRFGSDEYTVPAMWTSTDVLICKTPQFPPALSPSSPSRSVSVALQVTLNGQNFAHEPLQFTFEAPRKVTQLVPSSGSSRGNTPVLVIGTGGFINVSSDKLAGTLPSASLFRQNRASRTSLGDLRCRFGDEAEVRGIFVSDRAVRCISPPLAGRSTVQLLAFALPPASTFLLRNVSLFFANSTAGASSFGSNSSKALYRSLIELGLRGGENSRGSDASLLRQLNIGQQQPTFPPRLFSASLSLPNLPCLDDGGLSSATGSSVSGPGNAPTFPKNCVPTSSTAEKLTLDSTGAQISAALSDLSRLRGKVKVQVIYVVATCVQVDRVNSTVNVSSIPFASPSVSSSATSSGTSSITGTTKFLNVSL
jgi:hypothetical protein